jgi:hypothetical protein
MITDSPNLRQHHKIKKDYQDKEFVNPYFRNRSGKFDVVFYLKVLAVLLAVYVVVYSDLFRIKEVEINGLDMINREEISNLVEDELNSWRWYLIPRRNLLFLDTGQLAEKINERYNLKNLMIDKGWKKLSINIEEKVSFLIIYNQQKFYFADEEGRATMEISQEEAERYWDRFPVLNVGNKDIVIGDQALGGKPASFIIALNEEIKKTSLAIYGYEAGEGEEVVLVTKDGWRGLFSADSDPKLSLDNLLLVLNGKVQDKNKLEYIDVRFGDKVFYKER